VCEDQVDEVAAAEREHSSGDLADLRTEVGTD
jgi:hypothetical protein